MLAQPITDRLSDSRAVLLAGCGGGYDVFGAVPLLVELAAAQKRVVLASHSFCGLASLAGAVADADVPNLYEVPAAAATADVYCPEAWLARWCADELGGPASVWGFEKSGTRPLVAAYRRLIDRFAIDAVVLIDGGIDAILRGDESSLGTPAEDLASLAAVAQFDVPTRLIACVGLGGEMRDGICHEQVFGRIAELTENGGFLGAASLLADTAAGRAYLAAVDFAFANQQNVRTSHIHRVVSAAMRGERGSRGEHIWISPLLNMFWLFDLPTVAATHLFLDLLAETDESWEVSARIEGIRKNIAVLPRSAIPL